MAFILLLFLLGSFAWLAVVADRRIQARKQAHLETAPDQTATETKPDRGWHAPWHRPLQIEKVLTFRAWAVTTFADQPDLQHWLAALSDEAIQLLTAKLTDFCTDLGFEFNWLLEHKIDQEHALAPRLQTIAVQYIEACYQAYLAQEDVKVFQTWQDFTQHPYRKDQQVLAQNMLTQLLDRGLAPAAARSLLTAPEKEREVYIVQAVREASEKHPEAFRVVLKAVVTVENGVTPSPETANHRSRRSWLRQKEKEEQPVVSSV